MSERYWIVKHGDWETKIGEYRVKYPPESGDLFIESVAILGAEEAFIEWPWLKLGSWEVEDFDVISPEGEKWRVDVELELDPIFYPGPAEKVEK